MFHKDVESNNDVTCTAVTSPLYLNISTRYKKHHHVTA